MLYIPKNLPAEGIAGILFLILIIFAAIVIGSIIQLIALRIAMFFPPVRALLRHIMDTARYD